MEYINEYRGNTQTKGLSLRECELVQEFAKAKLAANSELQYEDLDDYEIPPRTHFSMLNKPAVSIKYKELMFNMACIRMFEGITQVLPSLSKNKKRLAIIMRKEEGGSTVQWARKKGDHYVNKKVTSLEFVDSIYNLMGWDKKRRYKVLGRIADSSEGLILVFDLEEAIMFSELPEEYVDKRTGEIKKRRFAYYPDMYKGRIGKTYSEYIAGEQISMFVNLDEYEDTGGELKRVRQSIVTEEMDSETKLAMEPKLTTMGSEPEPIT